ncbi:uncharacterized protein B0T23DRAFT_396964 [Neurospora hispaniola]|uniref:Uncharacterized protein n=1 Tax=Neurospora hispaniola TaxID=588809 RepID=A0AAJ0I693_9PEZI|nr:hypothetical protein B0T23DRAFT_396964 [Neurospora hispaniola]
MKCGILLSFSSPAQLRAKYPPTKDKQQSKPTTLNGPPAQNPHQYVQVGNGNFAFGADITGLGLLAAQNDIFQRLVPNPPRINPRYIGFPFPDEKNENVTEADLEKTTQTLDIGSGNAKLALCPQGVSRLGKHISRSRLLTPSR